MSWIPKNRETHLREQVAVLLQRTDKLDNLRPTSPFLKILETTAERFEQVDAGLYGLRRLSDLDFLAKSATITPDLEEVAKFALPAGDNTPRGAEKGVGTIVLTRPSSSGLVPIPIGSVVSQEKDGVRYLYETTAASSWADGVTVSAAIPIAAQIAGSAPNAITGAISAMVSNLAVTNVTNPVPVHGLDAETPAQLVQRIKDHRRSMSRVNRSAQFALVRQVKLPSGAAVRFVAGASDGPGLPVILIDDGTGTAGQTATVAAETLVATAVGGEYELFTSRRPWSAQPIVYRNGVELATTQYTTIPAWGQIRLVSPLIEGESITTGTYSVYEGLVAAAQQKLDGDPADLLTTPPSAAHGLVTTVRPATVVSITITGTLTVRPRINRAAEQEAAANRILEMTNAGEIGGAWFRSRAIERALASANTMKFELAAPVIDRYIQPHEVIRVTRSNIVIN